MATQARGPLETRYYPRVVPQPEIWANTIPLGEIPLPLHTQKDFPNPFPPPMMGRLHEVGENRTLIKIPVPTIHQLDWPNPQPIKGALQPYFPPRVLPPVANPQIQNYDFPNPSGPLRPIQPEIYPYTFYASISNPPTNINEFVGNYTWTGTTSQVISLTTMPPQMWEGMTFLLNPWVAINSQSDQQTNTLPIQASVLQTIVGAVGTYTWAGTLATSANFGNIIGGISGSYTWSGVTAQLYEGGLAGTPGQYTWSGTTSYVFNPNATKFNQTVGTWLWAGLTASVTVPIYIIEETPANYTWDGTLATIGGIPTVATIPLLINTPDLIIRNAMLNAMALEKGADPSSEDYAVNLMRLNGLVQFAQTQGLKLFLWQDIPVTLIPGTQAYPIIFSYPNMATNPLQEREVYYIDPSGSQRSLIPYSWQEWEALSTRSQQGTPTNVFINKQATTFTLNLWPIPDVTAAKGFVHCLVRTRAPQMLQINEQTMFPTEWYLFLVWSLAAELCQGQPQPIVARIDSMAKMYRDALEGFDVEDTPTQFQMDQRMGYTTSRFR